MKSKAPFTDFKGNELHEGDRIVHPVCKSIAKVVYDSSFNSCKNYQWRAVYEDIDENLWLGHQVGPKGQAVKHETNERQEK